MWPFTPSYTERPLETLKDQYDYIVVGGGNAGCVVASRLSEDSSSTVLLVERGDAGDSWLHRTPLTSAHHFSDGRHSDLFDSAPDSQMGRSYPLICGFGLGGSTRINGCQYTCGVPAEYDSWYKDGRKGWSYAEFKPYFEKSEKWIGMEPREYHGSDGPLQVRPFDEYYYECSKRAAEASERMGFPTINDMHSPTEPSIGWNKMQFTIGSDGTRQSAFRAYLPEDVSYSRRDRLHICTRAIACRLTFSDKLGGLRAEALEIQSANGGPNRAITARREIILACGALRTPQLLMLSGIGPQDHLREMGIEVIQNTPGVGANLQDHPIVTTDFNCPMSGSLWAMVKRPTTLIREIYNYIRYGKGWFLSTMVEIEIFGVASLIGADGKPVGMSKQHKDSSDQKNIPDFAVMAVPICDPRSVGINRSKGLFGLNASLLTPKSRGRLRLKSQDPNAHPDCDMQYLTCPDDYIVLRTALRVIIQLAQEMRAGGYPLDDIRVPDSCNDDALDQFIRERISSMTHYSSTCRMAPQDDSQPGVVDDKLRVHGIPNLRIADASILPSVPATHPQATVYAVAEKCADMVQKNKI